MHINEIDLNLLRLFDVVYRARNVSRAARSTQTRNTSSAPAEKMT